MSHPASPRQPPDHLPTDQSAVDEHELVRPILNSNIFDEEDTQRQEEEQEDENYNNDIEDGNQPQQEVKEDVAIALMTRKVGDTYLSSGEDKSLGLATYDPPSKPSKDKLGSIGNSWTDDEFNNNSESDEDNRRPSPAKRKRLSSSNNGPKQKKRKHHLEQKSTHQYRPRSKLHQYYRKSHSSLDWGSRVAIASSGEGQFPSPAPSAPQIMDTETPPDCSNMGGSSSDFLLTLIEATFRPQSPHCCSFTAMIQEGYDERGVSFNQVVRLIAGIGHVGKIDDFTIKSIEQHLFLVTGFSRHTPSRLSSGGTAVSTAAEGGRTHKDATRTRPKHVKATYAQALASQRREPLSSNDDGDLSDSDPDLSSDDDGCSSEDKQGLSTGVNIPWDPVDEQRLLAWKKEGKSWKWIFRKFQGRSQPAVRQRLSIVKRRGK
jgi:hypothetical protein